MRNRWMTACLFALTTYGSEAQAQLLTAICRGPHGATFLAGQREVVADGFGEGFFSYTWRIGEGTATIVSQSGKAAGNTPASEAAAALSAERFVTFLVKYERAIWMHTLFFDSKTVFITRHVDNIGPGTAVAGLYRATCSIATQ